MVLRRTKATAAHIITVNSDEDLGLSDFLFILTIVAVGSLLYIGCVLYVVYKLIRCIRDVISRMLGTSRAVKSSKEESCSFLFLILMIIPLIISRFEEADKWKFYLIAVYILLLMLEINLIQGLIFAFVWAMSQGKHHLWVLPNYNEDVNFFNLFWPLYTYVYKEDVGAITKTILQKEKPPNRRKWRRLQRKWNPITKKTTTPETQTIARRKSQIKGESKSDCEGDSGQSFSICEDFEIVERDQIVDEIVERESRLARASRF